MGTLTASTSSYVHSSNTSLTIASPSAQLHVGSTCDACTLDVVMEEPDEPPETASPNYLRGPSRDNDDGAVKLVALSSTASSSPSACSKGSVKLGSASQPNDADPQSSTLGLVPLRSSAQKDAVTSAASTSPSVQNRGLTRLTLGKLRARPTDADARSNSVDVGMEQLPEAVVPDDL